MKNETKAIHSTISQALDRRSKLRNRIIELIIWEIIWGGIGFLFFGMMLGIMNPLVGLILGLIGGVISYLISMINLSISTFFTAIKNETWHSIDELSNQLTISPVKLKELSRFLSNRGLIIYEENNHRIKIQPLWVLLLPEEQPNQPKTIVANFVIPPHASISIQSTHISNMSNVEVEVTLRIDNKIREVAISV